MDVEPPARSAWHYPKERLRWAGPGRLLKHPAASREVTLPCPTRSRAWLEIALLECATCHQIVQRRSSIQRHCEQCRVERKRTQSHDGAWDPRRRTRGSTPGSRPASKVTMEALRVLPSRSVYLGAMIQGVMFDVAVTGHEAEHQGHPIRSSTASRRQREDGASNEPSGPA